MTRDQPLVTRFGKFELDEMRHQLSCGGAEVHITPKAFELLTVLIEAAPRVVPKSELHERLWPTTFVSDATLVGLVKELRRALDDHDPSAPLIRTVQRIGYAFCASTARASAQAPIVLSFLLVEDRRIALRHGENTIGRDPGAVVWLDFPSVSRRHARILLADARAVLEDLGSKNGTIVGAEPLTGPRELRDGDRLTFGKAQALFFSSAAGLPTVTGEWSRSALRERVVSLQGRQGKRGELV
jgi:DNA-binding winged helix-turn-helix (wHTH) protein